MIRTTKSALAATLLTLAAFALSANAVPPLATTIATDFNVNYENFGYIFMLQFVCFAFASVTGGWASEKFGITHRQLVAFGVLSVGIVLAVGAKLSNFQMFIAWAVPLGFLGGLVETFSSIMICRFETSNSSKLMNLSQVFYCVGAILGASLVGFMLSYHIPWPKILLTLAAMIFSIGVFFVLATRRLDGSLRTVPDDHSKIEPQEKHSQNRPLYKDLLFYYLAGSLFLYVCAECSAVCWISAYFEKHFNLPTGSAAQRLSLFWTGMIAGRMLTLTLPHRWTLWPAVLIGAFGMMAGNAILSLNLSVTVASSLVLIGSLAGGPIWPIIVTISQKSRNHTRFTSCVIGSGALGAAAGPFVSSLIIRHLGTSALFPALTIMGLLLLFFLLLAKNNINK
ncbi:MAG: MFS transporter [Phycisphaerae bacterium]|jgi:FHS family glucose/mannose:H+ symporter-like MFS transporter|nr:MFS transporter [Phycisphaerae bacterium]